MRMIQKYPRKFWLLLVVALMVSWITFFIPYDLVNKLTGVSFPIFFILVSLVELICATTIAYLFMKYRQSEEKRNSKWKYHP